MTDKTNEEIMQRAGGIDVKALVEIGKQLATIQYIAAEGRGGEPIPVSISKDGFAVDLSYLLPQYPLRTRAQVKVEDVQSFIRYMSEWKSEYTRIFAATLNPPYRFVGIIDYPSVNGRPDWGSHVVTLELTETEAWKTWSQNSGEEFGQVEFAQFLEENNADIERPNGATMMELALALEATSEASFKSRIVLQNGATAFAFDDAITATAQTSDGRIEIPDEFVIRVSAFVGMPAMDVTCKFRYRFRKPHLNLAFVILRKKQIILDMVRATGDVIGTDTGIPVFLGTAALTV